MPTDLNPKRPLSAISTCFFSISAKFLIVSWLGPPNSSILKACRIKAPAANGSLDRPGEKVYKVSKYCITFSYGNSLSSGCASIICSKIGPRSFSLRRFLHHSTAPSANNSVPIAPAAINAPLPAHPLTDCARLGWPKNGSANFVIPCLKDILYLVSILRR